MTLTIPSIILRNCKTYCISLNITLVVNTFFSLKLLTIFINVILINECCKTYNSLSNTLCKDL